MREKLLRPLIWTAILLAAMVTSVFGCGHKIQMASSSPLASQDVAESRGLVEGSKTLATELLDHVAEDLKDIARSLVKNLQLIGTRLDSAQAAISKKDEVINTQAQTIIEQNVKLEEYKHQWIGDRAWTVIYWTIGILVAAWALIGVSGMLMSGLGGASVAGLGSWLLHLIPLANPFTFFRDKIRANQTTVSSVSSASTTIMAPPHAPTTQ